MARNASVKLIVILGLAILCFGCNEPTFNPEQGIFYEGQSVTINNNMDGSTIHYTLDGADPTAATSVYTGPIQVNTSTEIRAISIDGDNSSDIVSAVYAIEGDPTPCTSCEGALSAEGRWCNQGDGTVKDMTTGLVWIRDASCFADMTWEEAVMHAFENLRDSDCGLSDGSVWGDWRLPTITEFEQIIIGTEPVSPSNMQEFTGVGFDPYWSSTTDASNIGAAWTLEIHTGYRLHYGKDWEYYPAWPVRSDN